MDAQKQSLIDRLVALRKEIHTYPELSEQEVETARRIQSFIEKHSAAECIPAVGGTGLMAVHSFAESGPCIVIRCELDALPIEEENKFDYRSVNPGISHKCGHDGHMAILAGLSCLLKKENYQRGKVILLFQPAEETGTGAPGVVNDKKFQTLEPDYIFALHNIPGQTLGSIILNGGNFSSTVQSMAIELSGVESHSAQPEYGVNPALCLAELIQRFEKLNHNDASSEDFRLVVPVYSAMGKKSYGISAGFGELHYTLRTRSVEGMEKLKKEVDQILLEICPGYRLPFAVKWFDYFPAVVNAGVCVEHIAKAANQNKLEVIRKVEPFKFGEDFGWFSDTYSSAMFGIGAGEHSPALHQANYDFPDEIIEPGINMFKSIIDSILKNK